MNTDRKSKVGEAAFAASCVHVGRLPRERRGAALKTEAARLGMSAAAWSTRRSRLRATRRRERAALGDANVRLSRARGAPIFTDEKGLLEHAQAAAALDEKAPASPEATAPAIERPDDLLGRARAALGDAAAPAAADGDAGTPFDPEADGGPEGAVNDAQMKKFVVVLTVQTLQIAGRIVGARMGLSSPLVATAVEITGQERRELEDAVGMALPWIKEQLGEVSPRTGLFLYLGSVAVLGASKVAALARLSHEKKAGAKHLAELNRQAAARQRELDAVREQNGRDGPPRHPEGLQGLPSTLE